MRQYPNPLIFGTMYRLIVAALLVVWIAGCKPPVYLPKPPGYFKIDTPEAHTYQVFNKPGFPYTFEYPTYANIEEGAVFQGEKADNPYWININVPCLNGTINITYKEINKTQTIGALDEKAYEMSFFHHKITDYIDPANFNNGAGVSGITYSLGGNAASKFQFTATDSVRHFIRGALYFDVTPNADSLQPAYDFLERDIEHMLYTMRWK